MAIIAWNDEASLSNFRKVRDYLAADSILQNKFEHYDLDLDELMSHCYKLLYRIRQTQITVPIDYKTISLYTMGTIAGLPVTLHHIMFELGIRYLADDD